MDYCLSKESEIKEALDQLKDQKEATRSQAALSLGWIGDDNVIDPLVNALETDKSSKVRANAAMSLGQLNNIKAINPLITALNDKDAFVRGIVIYSLGLMKATEALGSLINVLEKDEDKEARMAAAESLAQLGDKQSIEFLIKAYAVESEEAVKNEIKASINRLATLFEISDIDVQIKKEVDKHRSVTIRKEEDIKKELLSVLESNDLERRRKLIVNTISDELPKLLEYAIHNEQISFDPLCNRFNCDDFTLELAVTKLLDKKIIDVKVNASNRSITVYKPKADLSVEAQEKLKLIRKKFGINW
jgi:HEAT repeat protein